MGNHKIFRLKFFSIKYCHFSRFRVFCSMKHTFSNGQKNCGVTMLAFMLSGKKIDTFTHGKVTSLKMFIVFG